jgi:microcystin degradation protein MlrC
VRDERGVIRVAVGTILQESNTFSPIRTSLKDFEDQGLCYGREVLDRYAAKNELGGFVAASRFEKDIELVPTLRAWAWSGGIVEQSAFDCLKDELLKRVAEAGTIDGVLLALHGSMVTDQLDDPEGEILCALRRQLGDTPVVATFDLHANMTAAKVKSLTALVGYHTSPHTDLLETGHEAAKILYSTIRGKVKPTIAWRKIPMITPAESHNTMRGPFKDIMNIVSEIERQEGVVSASLFAVQPWLDVKELGWSSVVVTDGDQRKGEELAESLAQSAWKAKRSFLVERTPVTRAIEEAGKIDGGPIVFCDSADSTNSGSPGDSTVVLKALLEAGVDYKALIPIRDPEAVRQITEHDVGRTMTMKVGGKLGRKFYEPIEITAIVTRLGGGVLTAKSEMTKNAKQNIGKAAVLKVGEIHILLTENRYLGHDPELFRFMGLEPRNAKIVLVKSPVGFRASYEPFAKAIFILDTPGASSSNLRSLEFRRAPRPLFPLDE